MSDSSDTNGSLRDILHAIGSTIFEGLQPNRQSAKIMKKHLLLAHAEVLKGCLAVVEKEIEELEKPAPSQKPRQKINIA